MTIEIVSVLTPATRDHLRGLLVRDDLAIPAMLRRGFSALQLECDPTYIRLRGRALLLHATRTATTAVGIIDVRPKAYRDLGARVSVAQSVIEGTQMEVLEEILDYLPKLLSETPGLQTAHINVTNEPKGIHVFERRGWRSTAKVERIIRRSPVLSRPATYAFPSGATFKICHTLSSTDIDQYVAASNDFYGVSCLDHAWYEATQDVYGRFGTPSIYSLCNAQDGTLIGFADCQASFPNVAVARQGNTYVLPAWRGRGVGCYLKEQIVASVLEQYPALQLVATHNRVDDPMMASLSKKLGFADHMQYIKLSLTL